MSLGIFKYIILPLLTVFSISVGQANENGVLAIQQNGKLIVALHQDDWPPFFYINKNNELDGLDIDIAKDIANKLGVTVEFTRNANTFDEIARQVENKHADIAISYLSNTLERAVHVRFTQPYVRLNQAALINRLNKVRAKRGDNMDNLLNSPEVKIGARVGCAAVSFAQSNYPKAQLVLYDSDEVLISDVRSGTLFAFLDDEITIKYLLNAHPDAAIDAQAVILRNRPDTIAMAVSIDNLDFQTWLDLYLIKIKESGYMDNIVHHYIETDIWYTDLNQ